MFSGGLLEYGSVILILHVIGKEIGDLLNASYIYYELNIRYTWNKKNNHIVLVMSNKIVYLYVNISYN